MATDYRTIVVRRGNTEAWEDSARPLAAGEWGYDETSRIVKIGDGYTLWSELPVALLASASGQLPDDVRATIAGNLGDVTSPEGAAVARVATGGTATDELTAQKISTPGTATNQAVTSAVTNGAIAPDSAGYDLVLLLGQSNMSGRGTPFDTVRLDPSSPRVEQYGSSGPWAAQQSVAVEPLAMHDTPTGIGPGSAFARWYAQSVPSARRVLLVPAAHGGTRLSTDASPLGWRRGVAGNLYAQAVAQAQAALAAAGPNSRIVAALWVQGESDGDSNTTGAQYQADLDALITGLRTDLNLPTLPFVVGQMVPDYLATGTRAQINAVHAATPARVPYTRFSQGVAGLNMNDGNHYNAEAQRIIGRNLYDAYRRIVTGAPDPSLPVAPGQVTGVVVTPSAASTSVAWSPVASASAYAVEYRVSGAANWTRAGSSRGTAFLLGALTPNTAYDVRVSAMNSGGVGIPSSTASFTSPDVPAVTDSFNRADNATTLGNTETGQAWSPNATVWGIVSNRASMISGANGRATVETGRANGTVQVTFATLSTGANHGRLLFRGDSSVNYWMVQLRVTGGVPGKYQLYKSVNGTLTQVGADSAAAGVAGDIVKVVMSGDNIVVSVNGSAVITVSDSFNNTATQHGLAAVGNGPTFDNFSVTA